MPNRTTAPRRFAPRARGQYRPRSLSGKEATRAAIEHSFRDISFLEPSAIDVYLGAADLCRKLRERGVTIRSTIDCIIAVIAEEAGCALLARDRDLDALLASGLVKVEPWPTATQ